MFSPRVVLSCNNEWCYADLSIFVGRYVLRLVYDKSSVIGLCVVIMWGVVGGGLIVVCRCGSVCKQIKVHNCGCSKVVKTGW